MISRRPTTLAFLNKRFRYPQMNSIHKAIEKSHKSYGLKAKALMIIARSGCGKTEAVRSYEDNYNKQYTESHDIGPILYIALSEKITPNGIITLIYNELGIKKSSNETERCGKLALILQRLGIELIIIDEIQHVLPEHTHAKTQECADFFKSFMDRTKIPFIFVGTPKSTRLLHIFKVPTTKAGKLKDLSPKDRVAKAEKEEEQLLHRTRKPVQIKPFAHNSKGWISILECFQKIVGVPCIKLSNEETALRCWLASKGFLKRIANILEEAIEEVEDGKQITLTDLANAYDELNNTNSDTFGNPFSIDNNKLDKWLGLEVQA
jgi:hypothetical protein